MALVAQLTQGLLCAHKTGRGSLYLLFSVLRAVAMAMNARCFSLLPLLLGMLAGSVAAGEPVPPMAVVGEGPAAHRFVLSDSETHQPLANTPYRLFPHSTEIKGVEGALIGVTDAEGQTATVYLPEALPRAEWTLQKIVGQGGFGVGLVFHSHQEQAIPHLPHIVSITKDTIYCGYSDEYGDSFYLSSPVARNYQYFWEDVSLKPEDLAWCDKAAQTLATVDGESNPAAYHQAMAHLIAESDAVGSSLRRVLLEKWLLEVADPDSAVLQGLVQRLLKDQDLSSEQYNNLGYRLITHAQPALGLQLVDQALKLDPKSPFALDSKGWALFKQGQVAQAQPLLQQSLKVLRLRHQQIQKEKAAEDDLAQINSVLAEALAHNAELQWYLGQHTAARKLLRAAQRLDSDSEAAQEAKQYFRSKNVQKKAKK